MNKKSSWPWSIVVVLLLGLGLRIVNLNQSFWLDETITAKVARLSFSQINQFIRRDFNPPLYYYLVGVWQNVFGLSEVILRLPSLLFGLGSICLLYLIGRRFLNSHARLAALLLTTSPLHIYYSQEARAYSLLTFTVLLASYFFQQAQHKQHLLFWLGFAISLPLIIFTHYQGFLFLPVFIAAFFLKRGNSRPLRPVGASFLLLLILFAFFWPTFSAQLSQGQNAATGWQDVLGQASLKNYLLLPIKFVTGRVDLPTNIVLLAIVGIIVGLYWLCSSWGTASLIKNRQYFPAVALFMPLFLGIVVSWFLPIFSYFRFLFLLPFFYLTVIKGILQLKSKRWQRVIIVTLLLINLTFSGLYLFSNDYQRENWRLALKVLYQNYPQQPVYIHPKINSAFEHYNNGRLEIVSPKEFGDYKTISLISYGLPIFDPDGKIKAELKELSFRPVWGDSFNGVGVEKWQKQND